MIEFALGMVIIGLGPIGIIIVISSIYEGRKK